MSILLDHNALRSPHRGGGSARLAAAAPRPRLPERTSEPGGESVSTDTNMPPNHHQAFILRHLGSPLGARTCPPTTSSSAARAVLVVVRASDWPRALVSVVPAGAYTSCSWPPLAPLASLEA